MRYDTEIRQLLIRAGDTARAMGNSYVGSAHLLLAMMQEPGMA